MSIKNQSSLLPIVLNDNELECLDMLYIAQFAPKRGQATPIETNDFPRLSAYHFDIFDVLTKRGLKVYPTSSIQDVFEKKGSFNYIFSLQNSARHRNSEVLIAAVAESLGISYLGAPANVRAIAEDKFLTSTFAKALAIPAPHSFCLNEKEPFPDSAPIPGPYIIKPRFGVNSEYIAEESIQEDWTLIRPIWQELKEHNIGSIIQTFIPGENVSVPFIEMLGSNVLKPTVGPNVGNHNVYTQSIKQNPKIFDRRLIMTDLGLIKELQRLNGRLRSGLGPVDYFRSDWRIHATTKKPYLIEFNVCCNISKNSDMMASCEDLGWSHLNMVESILASSLRRKPSFR